MKTRQAHKESGSKAHPPKGPFFSASAVFPKLTINPPNDKYEQEADAMAERVMTMPETKAPANASPPSNPEETEEEKPEDREEQVPEIQKMPVNNSDEEDEENNNPVMRKESGVGMTAPPALNGQLQATKGRGAPLSPSTRRFMSNAFGTGFGQVRVHTGAQADQMSERIQARAFTHGSDIYFKRGQYNPNSPEGKKLLAHELTHVVQQGGKTRIQRQDQDSFELEADTGTFKQVEEHATGQHRIGKKVGLLARIGAHQYEPGKDNYETIKDEGKKVYKAPNAQTVAFRVKYNEIVEVVGLYAQNEGWAFIATPEGTGWVQRVYLHYPLPDPNSKLYFVQEGDMLKDVIANEYGGQQGINVREWGADVRLYVHAIAIVNQIAGSKGIGQYEGKKDVGLFRSILLDETGEESQKIWNSAYLKYGHNIWLPSKSLIDKLKNQGLASAGSVSYTVVEAIKDIFLFGGGLIVGVFEGLWDAFVDTLTGVVDLFELLGTFIKKLFSGELLDWLKEMYEGMKETISNLDETAKAIWNEFMQKSAYEKGKAVGKVIGYILFEILLIYFTAGVVTAIKWAGKAGKLAKAFRAISKISKKVKKVEKMVPDPGPDVKDKVTKAAKKKKKWRLHEKEVSERLTKKYGRGKVAEQVTLEVTGPDGKTVRIRIDNLVDSGGGKYKLIDAKHSEVSDLTKGDLHSTLTENQKKAFKWLKDGEAKTVEVRGTKGEQIGLNSGDRIKVESDIEIHVNSTSGIVERKY